MLVQVVLALPRKISLVFSLMRKQNREKLI